MEFGQIAIVGATGFIGHALQERLSDEGNVVLGYSTQNPVTASFQSTSELAAASTVFWLASSINPSRAENNSQLVNQELELWSSFLEFLMALNPKCHVVFASSGGASYSGNNSPFSEISEANGVNTYGKTKIAMEDALIASAIPATILRISNVYGPGQRTGTGQGVIANWISDVIEGNPIHVFGSLDIVRDFVFIEDVVDALQACLNHPDGLGIVNIGSGAPVSLLQVVETIEKFLDSRVELVHEPTRTIDRPAVWLDVSRAKSVLYWESKTDLASGIQLTLAEYGTE